MSKIIDITEKLNFEEKPKLKVKGAEYFVNDDAPTMLKIMDLAGDGDNMNPKALTEIYELIFDSSEREKIDKLKLNFTDFTTLITSAITLVAGTDTGEILTPATI